VELERRKDSDGMAVLSMEPPLYGRASALPVGAQEALRPDMPARP
jgi:hypothetical protein